MAITSGFFNSQDGDRIYDAVSINDFFEGFVQEGVLGPVGGHLLVSVAFGRTISVASGKAWFLKTWLTNSQSKQFELDEADVSFERIDTIILDFDISNRINTIAVLTGIPDEFTPEAIELIDTDSHKQVPLAYITIPAGTTTITAGMIENTVGWAECPFATGLLQQATTDELLVQWNNEFQAWMASIEDDILEMDTTGTLAELVEMRNRPLKGRNILINGDMRINQSDESIVSGFDRTASLAENYPGIADRWAITLGLTSGSWDLLRRQDTGLINYSGAQYDYRIRCLDTATMTDPAAFAIFQQRIEGSKLGELNKGTEDSKEMTLSWLMKSNRGGTYIVELLDEQNSRSISHAYTVVGNSDWQKHSWVINQDFNTAGQLIDDNTTGLNLRFWFLAGTNYSSGTLQTTWGTASNQDRAVGQINVGTFSGGFIDLTDIQLEVGSIQSTYERIPYYEQLSQCQRYREYLASARLLGRGSGTNDISISGYTYHVPKRDNPTVEIGIATANCVADGAKVADDFADTASTEYVLHGTLDMGSYAVVADGLYTCDLISLIIDAEL